MTVMMKVINMIDCYKVQCLNDDDGGKNDAGVFLIVF